MEQCNFIKDRHKADVLDLFFVYIIGIGFGDCTLIRQFPSTIIISIIISSLTLGSNEQVQVEVLIKKKT